MSGRAATIGRAAAPPTPIWSVLFRTPDALGLQHGVSAELPLGAQKHTKWCIDGIPTQISMANFIGVVLLFLEGKLQKGKFKMQARLNVVPTLLLLDPLW